MPEKKKISNTLKARLSTLKEKETIEVAVILKPPLFRGEDRKEIIFTLEKEITEKTKHLLGARADVAKSYWIMPGFIASLDAKTIERLIKEPEVEKIDLAEGRVKIPVTRRKIHHPTRTLFKDSLWQYKPINAFALWDNGLFGEGIVVGHLDTGINPKHPELTGKIVGWARVLETGKVIPGKPEEAFDDNGHGSFTGGLIAGGSRENPLGIAPGARLISVKVLDRYGSGSLEQIIAGLQYIASKKEVKVVNMSWGMEGYLPLLEKPMINLLLLGILPVAAIGNNGPEISSSPANIPGVLSIGALDFFPKTLNYKYLYPAAFSATQFVIPKSSVFRFPYYLKPDLLAPGVEVVSTWIKGYASQSGSSAATPIVAGIVAALMQKYNFAPQTFISLLKIAANFASKPNWGYGWGIPDAGKLLSFLENVSYLEIVSQNPQGKPVEGLVSWSTENQYYEDIGYLHPLTGRLILPVPANTLVKLTVTQPQGKIKTLEVSSNLGTVPKIIL